ncbi:YtpR family tRNA-binding protein [Salirhabdus salicampi]|uniref:YtpR family tRNA-binding protein n=1 Tax=Salirhabdus salicampi TaxID=476102 RepID=UPI0020C50D78|nr:DUF4479 domain-containing protein [Salirhabdus salicampi]MCP8617152.1 DUF4479 domain-containing protein [Salirhabdus salicampi]
MQAFYNRGGIGDVLVIPVKDGNQLFRSYETYGDVVKIIDTEQNEVVGYNIFQASKYLTIKNSPVEITEKFLTQIHDVFKQNGLDEKIDVDLSPRFVVGLVKEKVQHENADKLSVCKVDVGDETLQIVCGAPNVDEGQKVVVAKVGAIMPSGMQIKATELRGVPSHGMICSAKELNLPDAPKEKGILVLDENAEIGAPYGF